VPSNSNKDIDVTADMNGSAKISGEDRANRSQFDNTAVCHNADRFSGRTDSPWTQPARDDTGKTGPVDCCRNSRPHNGVDRGADPATFCLIPAGVHSQDSCSHSGTGPKSLLGSSRNDCETSTPSDDVNRYQTSSERSRPNSPPSSQKPDKFAVNGVRGGVPRTADGEARSIPTSNDDDNNGGDGVIFNTSDFDVIDAIKADGQLTNRLLEFGDILHWDVRSLDLPDKTVGDSEARNCSLTGNTMYGGDENHGASMEDDSGVVFPSECSESSQLSDAVDRHLNQTRGSSEEVQPPRVFSDISDDDDVCATDKETVPDCHSRILPTPDEIQFALGADAADGVINIVRTDTANRCRNIIDNCENIERQNSADKLEFSLQPPNAEALYQDGFAEVVCRSDATRNSVVNSESQHASLTDLDDSTSLFAGSCNTTEMPARALARSTWNVGRIRRRGRNQFGDKTIHGVVERLLQTCGVAECSGQRMELATDVVGECDNHDMDKAIEEIILTTLGSELPALCGDGPGSPMDEAPPLLAITALLEDDDANSTEPTETKQRTATSGIGYDSDDFEAAMPVIEDMRSLLPTENELCGNLDEERSGAKAARKARKAPKPLKRGIPAAARETLEIERTRSLPFACDRCTFACGSEQVLHQHVKACHRGGGERARYVCTECPATAGDVETFLDHLAHHPGQHTIRYFTCSHCASDAVDMATMEEHLATSHSAAEVLRFEVVQRRVSYLDDLVNCPLCGAACRWKKNFVDHVGTYHQMRQLAEYLERGHDRCPGKLSIRRSDVVGQAGASGMEASSQRAQSAQSVSRYRDLSTSFNSSLSVVVHICCRCTFSTDDVDSYLEHYRSHFSTSAPPRTPRAAVTADRGDQSPAVVVGQRLVETPKGKSGGSYACHLCPFKTPKRMFYVRHMAIHERNTGMTDGFRCGYCQFAHPRIQCVKFHLGKYHYNRPINVVRISGGMESEIFDDGHDNNYEDETAASYPAAKSPPTFARSHPLASSYDSCDDSVSSFSSAATSSKSALPAANRKARELAASDRLKRLNEFERRLAPSMRYEEPVRCPLCSFADAVRINLLRHLRTHRNDEEHELRRSAPDNVGGFAAAEPVQNETSDAGRYARPAMEATVAVNVYDTGIRSISTLTRMTQPLIENHLVNITLSIMLNIYTYV